MFHCLKSTDETESSRPKSYLADLPDQIGYHKANAILFAIFTALRKQYDKYV